MENKKYYYLKLKEDFFDNEDIKIIESMENGYLYSNILLKMYLKSLKNNGELIFKDFIPYDTKMLATITGHNIDVVEKALKLFKQLGFIDVLDNGAIFMLDVQTMIGKISDEGIRKKEYREKINQLKVKEIENGTLSQESPTIISISNSNTINYNDMIKEIIDYLNMKTKKNYRSNNKETIKHIKARINEEYKIEDFKKVIDNQCEKWLNTNMEDYLRPQTLFGTKFESYLNTSLNTNNYYNKPQKPSYELPTFN